MSKGEMQEKKFLQQDSDCSEFLAKCSFFVSLLSKAIQITIGVALRFVHSLDEVNQIMHASVWLRATWKDEFLTWKPEDYGGISTLIVPANHIWTPDFGFVNVITGMYDEDYITMFRVRIHSNGIVWWHPGNVLGLNCPMNVRKFPFDAQECPLLLESWMYTSNMVKIKARDTGFSFSYFNENDMWKIIGIKVENSSMEYSTGNFSALGIYIRFKRKPAYFVLNVLVPCVILGILNIFLFVLPPNSGEKISLGMTLLLSYFVFLLLVAGILPPTSENFPLLGLYLCSVVALSALSLACSIFVTCLQEKLQFNEVPNWLSKWLRKGKNSEVEKNKQTSSHEFDKPMECAKNQESNAEHDEKQKNSSNSDATTIEKDNLISLVKCVNKFFLVVFSSIFCIITVVFGAECLF